MTIGRTGIFVSLGVVLGVVIYLPLNTNPTWRMVALYATLAFILIGLSICAVYFDRRERRLIEYKHWLCSTCEYPLHRASIAGRCPECGTTYTHRELQEYWIQRQARERGEKSNPYRAAD